MCTSATRAQRPRSLQYGNFPRLQHRAHATTRGSPANASVQAVVSGSSSLRHSSLYVSVSKSGVAVAQIAQHSFNWKSRSTDCPRRELRHVGRVCGSSRTSLPGSIGSHDVGISGNWEHGGIFAYQIQISDRRNIILTAKSNKWPYPPKFKLFSQLADYWLWSERELRSSPHLGKSFPFLEECGQDACSRQLRNDSIGDGTLPEFHQRQPR